MPVSAPKPCKSVGCGVRVSDGSGYCVKHKAEKPKPWSEVERGNRHERGYDNNWQRRRKRVLSRDKGLCQVCLKQGKYRPAKHVDHIINKAEAKAMGWTDEQIESEENLQSICIPCHSAKTAEEAKRGRFRGGGGGSNL